MGISQALPTDGAWLPLRAVVRKTSFDLDSTAEQALADYHDMTEKSYVNERAIEAKSIGTFRKLCVVVGGPGSGKTLLLKVLAREFAKDSFVSVSVRLRDLATRIRNTGCGIEEGIMQLGVDRSGVTSHQLQSVLSTELVLLCDGLDECGESQLDIASGLKDISLSHTNYRIIVTTRPIGYVANELQDWRHYIISPLRDEDAAKHMWSLSRCVLNGNGIDGTGELHARIQAYLNEGNSSKILARSPLLLGFGVALFLNRENSSKTKLELYQSIFDLIDETPIGRNMGFEPPPDAIRKSVLNELGWLISSSPIQKLDKLKEQCAQSLKKTLQKSPPYVSTLVEQSIRYWEVKGIIEPLHHSGEELIAFIHRSCGEFAAALHLSEMDEYEVQQALQTVLSNVDWDEILDFSSRTKLATILVSILLEEFESEDCDQQRASRLVAVLLRPEVALSHSERASFLQRVFALAQSEDRQKAYRVGLCLTEQDLRRLPEAERIGSELVSTPMEWSQLIGWTILVSHFPESLNRKDLQIAFAHFMVQSQSEDFFLQGDSTLRVGRLPERAILEKFVIGALKFLLPDQDASYQSQLIGEVRVFQSTATMGFTLRLDELLRELGLEEASSRSMWRSTEYLRDFSFSVPDEWITASTKVLTEVILAAFLDDDSSLLPTTGPKYLAAFVELCGIRDVEASDAYVWLSEGTRIADVQYLLQTAADIYELPQDRLAAEAKQLIEFHESMRHGSSSENISRLLPDVDVAEIDWSKVNNVDLDMNLVESLVDHPSQWIQHLTALVLEQRLQGWDL